MTALLIAGCASNPKDPPTGSTGAQTAKEPAPSAKTMSVEEILKHEDVKGHPPKVFAQPLDKAREAALRALTFVGCELKKKEPYYVSGRRPNKIGLFVGSGGETVEVFLYPAKENETHVWVDTDLSFVGIAGQQDWSEKAMAEISRILSQ